MHDLIPPFNWHAVLVAPWRENFQNTFWVVLMGFLVILACGLVGKYLVLRRAALMGDAMSHTVLLGLVGVYLIFGTRNVWAMYLGALAAGVLTAVIVELIQRTTRVKQDAAIGITFSTLFALGAILVNLLPGSVHIDAECILYGEIAFVPLEPTVSFSQFLAGAGGHEATVPEGVAAIPPAAGTFALPPSIWLMLVVTVLAVVLITALYKELLVTSFDPGLATSLGLNVPLFHYGLMAVASLVLVSSFEAVGAILVVAMLILPGVTAGLVSTRLPVIFGLISAFAALSAVAGFHLATMLDCSPAGAMVVAGAGLFLLAWFLSPTQGLIARWRRQPVSDLEATTEASAQPAPQPR